jgi:hypothetical protein
VSTPAHAAEGATEAGSNTTLLVIVGITVAAFVGAALAGRRVVRGVTVQSDLYRKDLLDVDLLGDWPRSKTEPRIVGTFATVFLLVLLFYALLDRGFAWFHVPGTPLFVGELTLALGVFAMLSAHVPMLSAIRKNPPLKAVVAWMAWGLVFLVLQLPLFGLDTIRDSALWYYAAAAILTVFLLLSDSARFGRWVNLFGRALPWILLWFPIAIAMDSIIGTGAPYVPDSKVPLFAHRFGNIAVFSAMCIGFIWLVDRERGRYSNNQRIVYTVLAGLAVLLAGFQNRGGFVSAIFGILLMLVFLRRRRGELALVLGGVAILLATVAFVSEVRIPISSGREISAAQMVDNITSVIDPSSGGQRQIETTAWRLNLWSTVVEDVTNERPLTGFGPGPNLGVRYGVSTNEEVPLRNPHNSHVGILARMGWVGVGLWAVVWVVWTFEIIQLRARLLKRGRLVEAGLAAWLMVSAAMILMNAIFDPTLEGPQVAMWLWTVFGFGCALMLFYSGFGSGSLALAPGRLDRIPPEAARSATP